MSDIIIEKLPEQRDLYLDTLKHLEFQTIEDPSEKRLQILKNSKLLQLNN